MIVCNKKERNNKENYNNNHDLLKTSINLLCDCASVIVSLNDKITEMRSTWGLSSFKETITLAQSHNKLMNK